MGVLGVGQVFHNTKRDFFYVWTSQMFGNNNNLTFIFFSYFPFEEDSNKLVREIGNVIEGAEITFQFAVKPEKVDSKWKLI